MSTIEQYIDQRWSPRAFDQKMVTDDILNELFSAAGRAPSSNNEQPWRFIIGKKGTDTYDTIYQSLVDFNQAWSKTAPILVIGIVKKTFSKNGESNSHAAYDLGAAVAHLTMKAFEHQLFVHQMGGFDRNMCNTSFKLSDDFETIVAFTIGYMGDKKQLHPKIEALEKGVSGRKPLSEIMYTQAF